MDDRITLTGVHHFALRVKEFTRSVAFYRDVFGFQPILEVPGLVLISNGTLVIGLRDQEAGSGDRFDEFRVGLDHISFTLGSRDELEQAARTLDQRGVPRGEIRDLGESLPIYVMAVRDPDNIQLELTAPHG